MLTQGERYRRPMNLRAVGNILESGGWAHLVVEIKATLIEGGHLTLALKLQRSRIDSP